MNENTLYGTYVYGHSTSIFGSGSAVKGSSSSDEEYMRVI